ncbi:hypothetical protein MtrunA17_Chr1g0173061 [Medicago truncatula]|uniref:Uncharacterized protein n=1 Tax=Medicago truncatula TaxID=3880 RepID=A0A396JS79_MEDTR|nr:hypothetical protein MtrunA17_Chr1g0173061 [Medicago truncatula]
MVTEEKSKEKKNNYSLGMEILKAYASMAVANSTSIGGDDTIFRVKLRRSLLAEKSAH